MSRISFVSHEAGFIEVLPEPFVEIHEKNDVVGFLDHDKSSPDIGRGGPGSKRLPFLSAATRPRSDGSGSASRTWSPEPSLDAPMILFTRLDYDHMKSLAARPACPALLN